MVDKIFDDRSALPILPEKRETLAEAWLKEAGELHGGPVDILKILDSAGMAFLEWSVDKMGADEARAYPQIKTIVARPDLFRSAKKGEPSALMKVAHEFGHCVINSGHSPKPLKFAGNAKLAWIGESESEETLAWQLARAIRMPRSFIRDGDTAEALVERFQVTEEQALLRLSEISIERRKGLQSLNELERPDLPTSAEKAWRRAAISEEHDSEWYRLSTGGYLVALNGYLQPHAKLGWYVHNGQVFAKDEFDPSLF